ncbi:complement regulator-acquiring protein [Borreliella americana]|uniref:complement regulator-acquiring protein n=1 Tax=Borreliella americana TaxID=478807 RepID=UPI001E3AC1ED|nr:complement regulator-acquiring protein [Borreliella americana]
MHLHFSKIDPKVSGKFKLKKPLKQKKIIGLKNTNLEENTQNFENESGDLILYNQKFIKTTDSELKEIATKLETQKKEENTQIDKINKEEFGILDAYIDAYPTIANEDKKMILKRMLYSSSDYKKENIETLKEILEKLMYIIWTTTLKLLRVSFIE